MEPPPCIQNAMMTKDKKPFTYTPGGINLSEIRSPRMARRIERNAAYEGVGTPPPSQNNRPQFPQGSLPPSTLAAMQPQMHVQVFPSGPPPPPPMNNFRGGNPPPPPSHSVPPPPPPPSQPLPTQKFRTGDHQEVERPDMTKIIPENPMRLLRKTAGPKIKNTLLDELYTEPTNTAQYQPQRSADTARSSPAISSPPVTPNPPFERQSRPAPAQTVQPQQKQPNYQKQNTSPVQQPRSPPIIERNEPNRNAWNQPQKVQPERNVNVGSIYIPPLNTQQSKNFTSPTSPQSPNVQSPGTPTLKEAPKPWQQKQQVKQEEVPEWAKREPNLTPSPVIQEVQVSHPNKQQQQPRWTQSQPSPGVLPHKELEQVHRQQPPNPVYVAPQQKVGTPQRHQQFPEYPSNQGTHPNAVFVTQPIVLQHPGSGYGPPVINMRENVTVSKQEGGARVIPIRVEGAESPIQNRQPNWPNSGTQSGSSRPIQRMAGNDVPERRFAQHPHEEMRKMQMNDSDQDLLNRFKQVPSDGRNHPHVRNIPIQIEGNGAPPSQCYVPPSQQTPAEEPKKYTGSSIPSRSFKMLQAMTGHDSCANAKEANRTNYDFPYCGGNWAYPTPAYPVCPLPPFWPPYYHPLNPHEYAATERSESDFDINKPEGKKYAQNIQGHSASSTPTQELYTKSGSTRRASLPFSASSSTSEMETINARKTPLPNWGISGRTTPVAGRKTPRNYSDSEHESNRTTPIPFWAGYPPPREVPQDLENNQNGYNFYPIYPPYYDPYYLSYYYGYPPIFPPPPPVYQPSESEDMNGYSSMDEMSFYNQKMPRSNLESDQRESPISTPIISVTPTPKEFEDMKAEKKEILSSDSDTDTEVNEEISKRPTATGPLQTIRSVNDINVYRQYEQDSEQSDDDIDEDDTDTSSESSVYEGEEGEEVVPHQLSVIFEVSEKTDISRNARESSITSDCTTVEAKSDDENDDDGVPANKEWISDNLMEIAFRIQSRINARIELDDLAMLPNSRSENSKHEFTYHEDNTINHCQGQEDLTEPSTAQNIPKISDQSQHCLNEMTKSDEYKFSNELKSKLENVLIENQKQNKEVINVDDERSENENNVECSENIHDVNEIACDKLEVADNSKESSDSEDWWGVIGNKEDEFVARKPYEYNRDSAYWEESQVDNSENIDSEALPNIDTEIYTEEVVSTNVETDVRALNCSVDDQVSSSKQQEASNFQKKNSVEKDVTLGTTSSHSSNSSADLREQGSNVHSQSDNTSSSESEASEDSSNDEEEEIKHDVNNNEKEDEEETVIQVPTIKDRIKALQESISAKRKTLRVDDEIKISVKSQILATDLGEPSRSKTISAKSSVKSFDEISEEDSGVTDMSRQFSDSEEFPELRKMTRYQRASTHSRLFQLLQGECEDEEDLPMEERKCQLTLPLVSDELADELVHSMLKQKKAQIFRNMSMEKLHAAAKRILQEDSSIDNLPDTPSDGFSEFLSPFRNDTGNSTPQEFYGHYNEYLQYYDSWAQASAAQDVNQKSSRSFAAGLAKCPRVLSGKNVHSDMMRLAATPEEPSLLPDTKS